MRIDVKDHQRLMSIQRTLTWVAQRGPEGKEFFFFNSIPYYYIGGKNIRVHTFVTEYSLFSVLKDPGNRREKGKTIVQEDRLSTYHTSYLFSGESWVSNPKSIYRANKMHKRK